MNNLRHAFPQLARSPGFSAGAVLALALGIGVCTAIFSIGPRRSGSLPSPWMTRLLFHITIRPSAATS